MKETTVSFSSTTFSSNAVSQDLLKLSENIHQLIGYHAALFDRGARFRAPSSQEAKQASRFLDELKRASIFSRSLFEIDPRIDSAQLSAKVQEYVDGRTLAARDDRSLQMAIIDVGERLLGFMQEIKRKSKSVDKLAA